MSCVHYKFKSSLDYDTLKFDGLHITLADLKKAIIQQKKLGKTTDFDLQVINAQTKEEYGSNEDLIPRNASVIIARVPIGGKPWEKSQVDVGSKAKTLKMSLERLSKTADLVGADASEEDKIRAMMTQSTKDYDRSNYVKPSYPTGPPPTGYLCYRCGQAGHFIQNCSLPKQDRHMDSEPARIKRSSGIPNSFLTIVDNPNIRGAVMTSSGRLAVPTIDAIAYERGKKEKPPFLKSHSPERRVSDEKMIPGELLCTLCNDLLADAVVIPCCGNSYCDECIREALLETEDHTCPSCKESGISPDGLIANKFLRTAVNNFLNETGYTKARRRSSKHEEPPTPPPPTLRHHPRETHDDHQQVLSVSASDLMVLRQEVPLSEELIGLPPQVVKARQAELTRGSSSPQGAGSTPPHQHDYHSRHHDDHRDDRRREDRRRDDRRHGDRRRDDRDRHRTTRTPTADEPMMSPPQAQMMQPMGQQQQPPQQQQPQLLPPQQQPPGVPMGMPPQQPPQQQNMLPRFNQAPPQNKFFSPPMVNNVPMPGNVPPGAMRPPLNMTGPPPPGLPMHQQQCMPQQPPPPGAAMPMMPNQFRPQGPIQQPPPQPMPPQMIPPQQPMPQGPMPMMPMPGPMPPGFRGPAPPGPQMGMPGPPGGDPRLPLPPTWGPRPPFPAPGPPPMSEQEFYREKQRLLEKSKPIHPPHDPMDDFEMQLRRYHSERRKNRSYSRSRSRSKSPSSRLRSSRSKSRALSHSRSRSRSRSRSLKRSRSRSKMRSRSRSKKRSRSRSKNRSRSLSKNRSRSRSKKRSRSRSKKRSRSRSMKRSRSRSKKRSRSRPRSYGRSMSRTRSSSLSRSWSSKLSRSRSRSRVRRRSLSRSLSKSPRVRRRKRRSRSPSHKVSPPPPGGPPGGLYNYRGRRSRSPPGPPPMPPYMRGGKDWGSPPGYYRDRSPGRMKAYSPERYPYPYAAQPRFEEMYRYPERIDPRWLEYYRDYENYMRDMQDRFGPPPPRYDMPWAGSGGRSPPRPPIMDMHRSRTKVKNIKKEKSSRHDHDPKDSKLPHKESERGEKERRTNREKAKLQDGEKEMRVKKAPSNSQEEKGALRHMMLKEGSDRGSSHSPHGKLRKRRDEAVVPSKDLRAKLTEKPADIKVLAAAVGVKTPKVESTAKTLPDGEVAVPAKKAHKSKMKVVRVKSSKKVKKEALNRVEQVNEKSVKRPGSAYPSVVEVVSPPKKAKMEADTTCHEDDIPAPEVEHKVDEVKTEKEDSAPGKEPPQQLRLVVTPPELSKWERDDYDISDTGVSPRRKTEVKRSLPRSVIESAEKVLSQKRPQVVASAVVSPPPSRSTAHKFNKEVERDRKVVSGGASSVQITITSSSSDKHHSSTEGKPAGKEGRRKEVEADKWKGERRGEAGEKHREGGGKYREEGNKFREAGSKNLEARSKQLDAGEKRKDAGDRHNEARDVKSLKSGSRGSRGSSRDAAPRHKPMSKVDPDNITSSRASLEKENKPSKSVTTKSREDRAEDSHREHAQPSRHISRKISVMDEASFEPDYNEDSQSDSEDESDPKTSKMEEDSTESSTNEQKKKKKKKHKHKHRKHKHKKHKHK